MVLPLLIKGLVAVPCVRLFRMALTLDFLMSPMFVKDRVRAVTNQVVTIVLVTTLAF